MIYLHCWFLESLQWGTERNIAQRRSDSRTTAPANRRDFIDRPINASYLDLVRKQDMCVRFMKLFPPCFRSHLNLK